MNQEHVNELVARGNAAMGRELWKPIETAPRDGSHFLAWGVLIADEEDEDGFVIRRGVKHENVHVVYWLKIFGPGCIVEFPFRTGTYGKPDNLTFTHWMPQPAGPTLKSPGEP